MFAWRKIVLQYRSISWFVAAGILLLSIFPLHFHFHHLADTSSIFHGHEVVLHAMTDAVEQAHHAEADVIEIAHGALAKQTNDDPLSSLALVLMLAGISMLFPQPIGRVLEISLLPHRDYYALAPPPRAPPLA